MKPPERPLIPPLPDAAVARIERRVFAALDSGEEQAVPRRRGRGWWLSAALVPVGLGLAVLAVRALRPDAELTPAGMRIATAGTPSHVTIRGAAVDVAPSSAVSIGGEADGSTVVTLERGAVTCRVAPRPAGAPFVVQAGATRVTVVGTRFTVSRQGEHAAVSVEQGVVEVGDDGVTRILHAGERYQPGETAPGQVDQRPPATAPAPARAPERTASHQRVRLPPPASPRVASANATAAAAERIDSEPLEPQDPAQPDTAPAAAPTPDAGAPAPSSPDAAAAAALPPLPTPQQRFEDAVRLEPTAPAESLRLYQELAGGTGPWAANALFAAARLQAERGRRDEARALLDAYLQRFPDGNNAADARVLLGRLR